MDSFDKDNDKEDNPKIDKILCEICGSLYNKKNRARHLKSNKCRQVRYVWTERFEITK